MSKVDITPEAVEQAMAIAGQHGLHKMKAAIRAQAERIKELEADLQHMTDNRNKWVDATQRARTARNNALREAARVCYAEADQCTEIPRITTCNQMGSAILALIEGDKP